MALASAGAFFANCAPTGPPLARSHDAGKCNPASQGYTGLRPCGVFPKECREVLVLCRCPSGHPDLYPSRIGPLKAVPPHAFQANSIKPPTLSGTRRVALHERCLSLQCSRTRSAQVPAETGEFSPNSKNVEIAVAEIALMLTLTSDDKRTSAAAKRLH